MSKKLSLPKPVAINLNRWPALDPKSAAVNCSLVVDEIHVDQLVDRLQSSAESRGAWQSLGPENGKTGEVLLGDYVDHLCAVAAMRYILKADHAMRAAVKMLTEYGTDGHGGHALADIDTVTAMLTEAIRPSVRPGNAYCDYIGLKNAAKKRKLHRRKGGAK